MPLINREIIKLIEDTAYGRGEISKRKFTEDFGEFDEAKIETEGHSGNIKPGAKIIISWDDELELEDDEGYIFTLPGFDSDDIFMSGIVHVPEPNGCEKCKCDPEWIYLDRLLANDMVKKVKINAI